MRSAQEGHHVIEDDDLPKPGDPLAALVGQDLDRLSVDELERRVRLLKAEIARSEAKIASSRAFRSDADALFKS